MRLSMGSPSPSATIEEKRPGPGGTALPKGAGVSLQNLSRSVFEQVFPHTPNQLPVRVFTPLSALPSSRPRPCTSVPAPPPLLITFAVCAFGSGRVAESLVFGHETAFWHDVACALFDRRSATWDFSERGSFGAPKTDEKRRFACQNAVSWPFSGRFRARARRPARRAQLIRPARPTRLA